MGTPAEAVQPIREQTGGHKRPRCERVLKEQYERRQGHNRQPEAPRRSDVPRSRSHTETPERDHKRRPVQYKEPYDKRSG